MGERGTQKTTPSSSTSRSAASPLRGALCCKSPSEAPAMELYPIQYHPWPFFLTNPSPFLLHPTSSVPESFVLWSESAEAHLFRADLPGVRKEEIRVEVEDARYLIIRTEIDEDGGGEPERKRFLRKFRLPERIDVDGISAAYEDGVLTVTAPRLIPRGRPRILPSDVPQGDRAAVARAA